MSVGKRVASGRDSWSLLAEVKAGPMLADIKADAILDARGLLCPMPTVKAKLKLDEMARGQVLEVVATDEGTREDIPAWCDSTGNEFLGLEEGVDDDSTNVIRLMIRKGSDG